MAEEPAGRPPGSGLGPCPPTLEPDQVVAGRFRVVGLLARGGMGEVYEVVDQELGSRVALKTLRPDLADDPLALERFRREVQLARQVTHRNVCRLFDLVHHHDVDEAGRPRTVLGLTMELLEGETLGERLARHGPMAPEQALPIIRQMIAALATAHRVGVVHRDFKSGNVILIPPEPTGAPGRVVVTDFGLAYQVAGPGSGSPPLTAANMVVGTADYMAPEQAQGREATPASDIYALGVVIYEMVTGQRPHEAATPIATLLRRLREPPPSARERRPDLELRWDAVIRRCLTVDPGERFASAGEVLAALEGRSGSQVAALGDEAEPPQTAQLPALGEPRRRRALWLGLGAMLAGALVAAGILVGQRRRPPTAAPPVPVQLTTWSGLELDPAFSPDGHTVAFAANRSGRFEIYLLQLATGGRDIQLTADGEQNFQPDWSPDGAFLAYASHGRRGIWLIPSLGGTPRPLIAFGSHPAWSPDGGWIAFQSEPTAELSASAVPALPPSTLWVAPAAGGEPRQVTREGAPPGGHGAPAWTPDGRRLVFTASDRRRSAIWTVALDGSDLRLLTDTPAFGFDPHCSQDGRRVLFAGVASGDRYAVWSLPLDRGFRPAGPPTPVLSLPMASVRQLDVSRDGRRLVHAALGTATNLWTQPLHPSSGEPRGPAAPLTSGSGRHSRPVFSADGGLLAFDHRQVGASQDIWVMDAEGASPRQLTVDPVADGTPSFLPGADGVAFVSERGGALGLWSIGLGGGSERRLAPLPPGADGVRVAPDGREVVYHVAGRDGAVNLWLMSTDGSSPRQLTFDPELVGFACWSPDGRWLAAERRRGENDHLVVVPAGGGEPRQLTGGTGKHWAHSWSPDGTRIAIAALLDGRWNLHSVALDGSGMRQLIRFDALDEYVRYPAWSPQGDRIVFVRAQSTGDLWMVENLP